MTNNPKRCIIYVRVSSDEQAGKDKMSIPDQLTRQRERAVANGWLVIDEIIIDGFSADYFTYREFTEEALENGFPDPMRMWAHWEQKDFDIISCRDLSRLGRKQSILNEFIERTIASSAVIMPLDEGALDSTNFRFGGAIGGVGAAAHIDKLKAGRDMGMKGRAARGEMLTRNVPMFYALDANGKLYPDRERYQRLFDDFAELFLSGMSFEKLPYAMEERGHVSPVNSKRFHKNALRRILLSARTWGHAEFNRTGRKRGVYMKRVELWVTGRTDPPPDVFFKANVCEPLWTGQQGEDMKDELERRYTGIRGASRPQHTYALTRMCVCGVCGRYMAVQRMSNRGNPLYYVVCHHGRLSAHTDCNNNLAVRFEKVMEFIDLYIDRMLTNPHYLPDDAPTVSRLPAIDKDLERLQARIDNLMEMASTASPSARADYQRKIDALVDQRGGLQVERLRVIANEREAAYTQRQRETAMAAIKLTRIWDMPTTQANQFLRKLFGNRRIVCNEGDVTGLRVIG